MRIIVIFNWYTFIISCTISIGEEWWLYFTSKNITKSLLWWHDKATLNHWNIARVTEKDKWMCYKKKWQLTIVCEILRSGLNWQIWLLKYMYKRKFWNMVGNSSRDIKMKHWFSGPHWFVEPCWQCCMSHCIGLPCWPLSHPHQIMSTILTIFYNSKEQTGSQIDRHQDIHHFVSASASIFTRCYINGHQPLFKLQGNK